MANPADRKTGVYYPDGREIPKEDLPTALAKDQARWMAGTKVPMVAPDGTGWEIPAEAARAQLQKGWRPRDAHEHALAVAKKQPLSMTEALGATAAGFTEALPFGRLATDQFLTEQEREIMMAKAPLIHGAAEVGGFVAPLFVTGGLSAVARAGAGGLARVAASTAARAATAPARGLSALASRAGTVAASGIESTVAKRAVATGVASGIEGATYAAGNELARQMRGDQDFNAEAFASAVGVGALFGTATGAGLGAAGSLAAKGAKRGADAYRGLTRRASGADDAASAAGVRLSESDAWALKSVGVTPGQHKGIPIENLQRAAQELKDLGIISKSVRGAISEDLVTKAHKFDKAFEEMGKAYPGLYKEADALIGKLPSLHPKATVAEAISSSAQLARKEAVVKTLTQRIRALRDRAFGDGEYGRVADKLEESWLGPLQHARTLEDLHKLDGDLRRTAETLKAGSIGKTETDLFRGDLKTKIRKLITEASPELGVKLRKLDDAYAAFAAVKKPIADAAASGQAKTISGMTPYEATLGVGGIAFGTPGIGAALAGAHAVVRHLKGSDRFAAAAARLTEEVADVATKKRFTIAGAIKDAAARSPVKISLGTPGRLAALTRDYHEKADSARQAVVNPQPAMIRIANNLAPIARANPDQARRMAELYADDLAWLASRVPPGWDADEDLNFLLQTAAQRSQAVPPSAATKFVRRSNVLADPLKEVEKVSGKSGALPAPETAEVLRERRPKIRERVEKEFDQQALTLAEKGQKMTYKTRVQASILTGKPYDPSMRPISIQFSQGRWNAKTAPAPVSGSGAGGGTRRGRVTQTTRGRVTRFNTTAQQTMEPSDV